MHSKHIRQILKESSITLGVLLVATALCYILDYFKVNELNFIIIYVLGILLTAIFTKGYVYSLILSVVSVLAYDFCFTVPRLTFHFHDKYIVTLILMLCVGILVSVIMFQFKKKMQQVNTLNIEKAKLRSDAEKEQLKATLLRSISHDLRTPLTTIKNGAEILIENGNNIEEAERNNILGDIEYKANWTIRLVENLLSLSRIDNEHLTVQKSEEAVEEIIPEAVRSIRGVLENRHIHYDTPDELLLVPMDATLIIQTIGNILVNAIRHTSDDGNIWIRVFNSGKNAVFRISNDGEPIKDMDIDHIFEMYYTDMNNKNDRGVGLGLPICKLVVTAHGGKISARNTDDGRVEFEFTLPMEDNNG